MADEFLAYEDVQDRTEAADETHEAEAPAGAHIMYSSGRISGFQDMLLKPEILKAISDAGFEHPSQVQHDCIHPATLGNDVLCQAKAGMGKTGVYVFATLQVLAEPADDKPRVLVVVHTRELAQQALNEFKRFSKYIEWLRGRIVITIGGVPREQDVETIATVKPVVVIGTFGRLYDLATAEGGRKQALDLSHIEHFVIDEADRLLSERDSLTKISALLSKAPKNKQTMMFSATMPAEVRTVAKRFLRADRLYEKYVDADTKLTLHGLDQFYMKVEEKDKITMLFKLIDENRGYNQVIIFVKSAERAKILGELMVKNKFPTYTTHGGLPVDERLAIYDAFKKHKQRFLVATELIARGVDVQGVNCVINYDCPADRYDARPGVERGAARPTGPGPDSQRTMSGSDQYLHRIGRAGRFGTRGAALTFLSSAEDVVMMNAIRTRFSVAIKALPADDLAAFTRDLATTAEDTETTATATAQ